MLADDDSLRQQQRALIEVHAGKVALESLDRISPDLGALGPEHKFPLAQLALPTLRLLESAELARFLETLDELVHADQRISTFEFALQKLLTRGLSLGQSPKGGLIQLYSFNALILEIGVVLSALAQASTRDSAEARTAFEAGANQLKLIQAQLSFDPKPFDFLLLDAALDKLATASAPIKQRTLLAAAHVACSNGSVSVAEAELLRAIAAAFDVPIPPLA